MNEGSSSMGGHELRPRWSRRPPPEQVERIRQAAPQIQRGSGVAGAAADLESAFRRAGVLTSRLTLADLPAPRVHGDGPLQRAWRMWWFTVCGTRVLRRPSDAVTICHNDALGGDVYVNHGLLKASLQARGRTNACIASNPVHVVVLARDRWRYSRPVHRAVVCLCENDAAELRRLYPRLASRVAVIGHGVDSQRFTVPDDRQRQQARRMLALPPDAPVVLFIGHEHDRKGLGVLLAALRHLPDVRVLAVGGPRRSVEMSQRAAAELGVADRLHAVGPMPDVRPALHAADVLCQPSAYESFGLVVLEAMACGLPVVSTPVGCAPDLLKESFGRLVPRTEHEVARGLREALALDPVTARAAARERAEQNTWDAVAQRYQTLIASLGEEHHCG